MSKSTSATLSLDEIEKLHKIKEELGLNKSSAIRISLRLTKGIDLDKYIDRTEQSKEVERERVHYSTSEKISLNIESLSDFHGVSKSKIVGAAILAFSDQDFFSKK